MAEEEFRSLLKDIRKNGLIEPIWIYQGRIVDGRHRYKACVRAGITPVFREWDGNGSLVAFVMSLNLHRRNLTASQRATIAVKAKKSLEAEIKEDLRKRQSEGGKKAGKFRPQDESQVFTIFGKDLKPERNAQKEAAKLANVSKGYVADAEKVKEVSPETFERLGSGELSISQAKRELGLSKPKPSSPPIENHPPAPPVPQPAVSLLAEPVQFEAAFDEAAWGQIVAQASQFPPSQRTELVKRLRGLADDFDTSL